MDANRSRQLRDTWLRDLRGSAMGFLPVGRRSADILVIHPNTSLHFFTRWRDGWQAKRLIPPKKQRKRIVWPPSFGRFLKEFISLRYSVRVLCVNSTAAALAINTKFSYDWETERTSGSKTASQFCGSAGVLLAMPSLVRHVPAATTTRRMWKATRSLQEW